MNLQRVTHSEQNLIDTMLRCPGYASRGFEKSVGVQY